jgi:diguanylate cyclase (GGDEF)-like protein
MENFLGNFDTHTACLVGALIVGMLAFMALAQVKQFPHFKIPFMSLACGLIFGAIGMGYLAMGIEQSDPIGWHFAHMSGTLSYFFIVISLIQLFRPDVGHWKPSVVLGIALLGTLFFPVGVATVVWTKIARMLLVGWAVWAAATTRNKETPLMRRLALWLSVLAIAGMFPQLMMLLGDFQSADSIYNSRTPSAVLQSLSWITSAVMSYVGIATIIQGRIAARLQQAADYDSLTHLNNRRVLMRHGQSMIGRLGSVVLLIDVDHFKKVNDTHGHLVGDAVLAHVASVIKHSVRDEDSVVGRYGGEEFCIMLADVAAHKGSIIAERVCGAVLANPYRFEGITINLSVSIGLASLMKDQCLQSWLKTADDCLYLAKQAGRNQVRVNQFDLVQPSAA